MKYKIKEIRPNIFAISVKSKYERAMLFCRVQEFYESPSEKFRGKRFGIWDYFRWYAGKKGCFSYPSDWSGFNLPLVVAKKCCDTSPCETPYDLVMSEIVSETFSNGKRQYLIGVENTKDSLFKHEMAHALYYTDLGYKEEMDSITESLPKNVLDSLKKNLKGLGYDQTVFKDEVQAYLSTEQNPVICKGLRGLKKITRRYVEVFKRHNK